MSTLINLMIDAYWLLLYAGLVIGLVGGAIIFILNRLNKNN